MKTGFLILFILLICSCHSGEESTLFELLPSDRTNIDFENSLIETETINMIEYLYFNNGGGVAVGDINNDGLEDLYFTANQGSNKLYLNKGNMVFEDITEKAGVAGSGSWKTGVTMEDINGDGLLDIYICQVGKYKNLSGRNQLFINKGDLTFKEEAKQYGLDFCGFSTQAAFFDYDLDGDLDMYLLNHSVHAPRNYGDTSLRRNVDNLSGHKLYRNDELNGNRHFKDVTLDSKIYSNHIAYGLGVKISDINNDGYPDLFISNDFNENDYLYINNKNGTFSEQISEYFAHTSKSSMGNDIGDFNNDGLQDVLVLDMLPQNDEVRMISGGEDEYDLHAIRKDFGYYYQFTRNTLQLNMGNNVFSEIGRLAGIFSTDWSWSPLFCDLDNDGWKDIFITSGIYRRANDLEYLNFLTGGNRNSPKRDNSRMSDSMIYSRMPLNTNNCYFFKNMRDYSFADVTSKWGLQQQAFSNGSAYADLDNDGDLDLIVNNINSQAFILKNKSSEKKLNHFLIIKLEGDSLNKKGTGTKITIYYGKSQQVLEQFPTKGFESSSSEKLIFGLGQTKMIDSIRTEWPGGKVEVIKNVRANSILTISIKNSKKEEKNILVQQNTQLFNEVKIPGFQFVHKEDPFNVFMREPLAMRSLTSDGPALAVADVNEDKLDDIFCGGAKGQEPQLFLQQKNGTFKSERIPCISDDLSMDAIDAAFFDADGDGDNDLYIARGGNQFGPSNTLCDFLLINTNGTFSKRELPLISHNGSCVRPCDFDKDNDLDLFVGSSSYSGAYGWPAEQFLLLNDGKGYFTISTNERMPSIKNGALVSDAAWFDYDTDGDSDLALAGDWMPITILENNKGFFRDISEQVFSSETSGWWYSIKAADINEDGKTDLIAGNVGLNTIFKPSEKEPVVMYLSDFNNNGTLDQIICRTRNGKEFPMASFDEIATQYPSLKTKFKNIQDYGGKMPEEIFGKEEIESAIKKKALEFESCVYLNSASGKFSEMKLPVEAQFSPIRALLVHDFNNDNHLDLIMAGNDYQVRPTYGRYDALYGATFIGKSEIGFEYLPFSKSGFFVKGDARKIVPIRIKGNSYLLVAVNNSEVKVFKCNIKIRDKN
ncbi:MAG: VCBS repeat-containing protein [Bacteroidales bacterium]